MAMFLDGKGHWVVGVPQDCEELGKFMGDLLSQRRYRWISRKKAIYCGSEAKR
jgi:hypothetical protein